VHAEIGDRIVVEGNHQDSGRRRGTVVGVLGNSDDEVEHYRVRWQDGHESVFFPGADARVDTVR
jgi:hypothetical protein